MHAVYIVNLLINNYNLQNISGYWIFVKFILIKYNSLQNPYLKFQNWGSGAQQLRQGFLMKTPTYNGHSIQVKTSQVDHRVQWTLVSFPFTG